MAESNATAATSGGLWSKLGSMVTEKALDLADSYAALKLGTQSTAAQATATPATAPASTPATVQAPSNNKVLYWIAGGLAVVVILVLALRPSRRR